MTSDRYYLNRDNITFIFNSKYELMKAVNSVRNELHYWNWGRCLRGVHS